MYKSSRLLILILISIVIDLEIGSAQQLMLSIGHLQSVRSARFSHNGKFIVTTSDDFTIKVWERQTGKVIASYTLDRLPKDAEFISSDSAVVIRSETHGMNNIWSPATKVWNFQTNSVETINLNASPGAVYYGKASQSKNERIAYSLYERQSRKLIMNFEFIDRFVDPLIFSDDNRFVATVSHSTAPGRFVKLGGTEDSCEIKCYDIQSRKLIATVTTLESSRLSELHISPKAQYLLMKFEQGKIKVFYTRLQKVLYDMSTRSEGSYVEMPIKIHPDGSRFIMGISQRISSDTTSKREKRAINYRQAMRNRSDWGNRDYTDEDSARFIHSAGIFALSDGKLLLELKGHTRVLTSAGYSKDGSQIYTTSYDQTARIWNANSGQEIRALKGHAAPINDFDVSDDNRYIITASRDLYAKIWDINSGHLVSDLMGHARDNNITKAKFSPDGKMVVTNAGICWDISSGKIVGRLQDCYGVSSSIVFSPDGKYVYLSFNSDNAYVWDLASKKRLLKTGDSREYNESAVFHRDGRHVITLSSLQVVHVYDLVTAKEVISFAGDTLGHPAGTYVSPRGTYIVLVSAQGQVQIKESLTGKVVAIHQLDKPGSSGYSWLRWAVLFPPDERSVIIRSTKDSSSQVYNLANGVISEFPDHQLNPIEFSPDGEYIATIYRKQVVLLNSVTGKLVREMEMPFDLLDIPKLSFSPDASHLMLYAMNLARVWDTKNGKLVGKSEDASLHGSSATFSTDGKFIIMRASVGKAVYTWDYTKTYIEKIMPGQTFDDHSSVGTKLVSPNGSELVVSDYLGDAEPYRLFAVDSVDYVAIDKDGRYDGTGAGRRLLYYVCNDQSIELQQFKDLSWEPGLVNKLNGFNAEPITAKSLASINICNIIPGVEEMGFRNGAYHYKIIPNQGGVGEVQLFANAKLIRTYQLAELAKNGKNYLLSIPQAAVDDYFLPGMQNEVTVKATTGEGNMTSRGAVINSTSTKRLGLPNVYIVSIGISKYKGESLRLNFASKDAVDFSTAIAGAARKLLNTDGKEHVIRYDLNTENQSKLWPDKLSVKRCLDSIALHSKADDILLIFFAGHGMLRKNSRDLYLLTAEAMNFEQVESLPREVAISTTELNDWMRKIKANKQVLVMDACNSGQVVDNLQKLIAKREVPADQQRALDNLRDKTGTYILSASASGQAAYETSLYGQGLLTYCLLSSIKLGNGLKDNKYIDISKWFNVTSSEVQNLARGIGGRQDPQILGAGSFDIGLVDAAYQDGIRLSVRKKVFKRSTFIMDQDLLTDDLKLSELVDRELNEESARGSEGSLTFVPDNSSEDGYSIKGKYEVNEQTIMVNVSVFKGLRDRVASFVVNENLNEIKSVAKRIVEVARQKVNQ